MIEVMYTCHSCGLTKQRASVTERADEDVVAWMDGVMRQLARDHEKRRPLCFAKHLDVMVPTTGRNRIGGPVQH